MRSMTHQSFDSPAARPIEAGAHVAHLRHVLGIVHEMAEFAERGGAAYHALDQAARISAAYERSLPVVRRRFDALAEETVTWTSAALAALQTARLSGNPPRAAAAQLAQELDDTLAALARMVGA
jgi:hypothetical protein